MRKKMLIGLLLLFCSTPLFAVGVNQIILSNVEFPTTLACSNPIFTRLDALTLSSGEDQLHNTLYNPADRNIYVVTDTNPTLFVKVNADSFTRTSFVSLVFASSGEAHIAVIEPDQGFAYIAVHNGVPQRIQKVRLSDMTVVSTLTLPSAGASVVEFLAIDTGDRILISGDRNGVLNRIDLSTFLVTDTLSISISGFANVGILDETNNLAYIGMSTAPVTIVEVDYSSSLVEGSNLLLNGGEFPIQTAIIDQSNFKGYFSTATNPADIIKIDLPTLTRESAITLTPGANDAQGMVIDTINDAFYVMLNVNPGISSRVRTSSFTHIANLLFDPGEAGPRMAAINIPDQFIYVGVNTIPGIIVRLDICGSV
jgi:hypothetical protein